MGNPVLALARLVFGSDADLRVDRFLEPRGYRAFVMVGGEPVMWRTATTEREANERLRDALQDHGRELLASLPHAIASRNGVSW